MSIQTEVVDAQHYKVYIGDIADVLTQLIKNIECSSISILVDNNTRQLCLPILLKKLPNLANASIIEVKNGEEYKNIDTCQLIWQQLLQQKADRKTLLINLGGGVIGDMGGFAASTYKRGIRFIQVPTTLLSQVDASVGGKLGIDFMYVKNIIGCFNYPEGVFIDPQFLDSLPQRQLYNGFAEVIKHALIADIDYWQALQSIKTSFNQTNWLPIIKRSVQLKQQIVAADPYEQGVRKILNFGHTIGHAIETYSIQKDKAPLLHGEAIALGMLIELELSVAYGGLSKQEAELASKYIAALYPKYTLAKHAVDEVFTYLQNDKKNTSNSINFSLISQLGHCLYDINPSRTDIEKAIGHLVI